ncbi:unnamed protein product [Pseudo-nitzschia multistriata]|uniref:Phosducin thioredoxin-like domain-containing protein n=1 Tax=Pseudo-nitzschia multistriata TaxID=183589 RepID=A0A448Z7Q5_9STRA|nr:unnamed protein product [Pseudo-nitzschia multistriata]
MMQGRGVTNFSGDKPSHGYTTSTTEFDDELIKRGIVTTEQAMMAKGASLEEAFRLAEEKRSGRDSIVHKRNSNENNAESQQTDNGDTNSDVSDDDDDFDFDDDDGFMERYRRERIEQLQKEHETKRSSELMLRSNNPSSQILHIAREEWKEEVNEASMGNRWVIITMVEASGDRRDRVVQELHKVAREFFPERLPERNLDDGDGDGGFGNSPSARLLTIDASEAIPNWPEERVPAMFAYRNGVKQHEWIASRRGEFPSRDILEELFRQWNLI